MAIREHKNGMRLNDLPFISIRVSWDLALRIFAVSPSCALHRVGRKDQEQKELLGGRQVSAAAKGHVRLGKPPLTELGAAGSTLSHLPGLWRLLILPEKGRIHAVSVIFFQTLLGPPKPREKTNMASGLAASKVGGVLIFCHS